MTWLADVALKGTVVLGAAWLGSLAMRRASAAARHVWWSAAIAALAALPLLTLVTPSLRLPVPAFAGESVLRITLDALSPAIAAAPARTAAATAVPAAAAPARDWRPALLWLWAFGTLVALLRLAAAHLAVARMRRRTIVMGDPAWQQALVQAAAQLGITRPVRLLRTPPGTVPLTFGWRSPAICLPTDAAGWSGERRQVVLLHELAHVERGDAWIGAVARFALCGYWFHPLAWVAERELLRNREAAADDCVLTAGAAASAYAAHLLEIARASTAPPALGSAAICMSRGSQLEGRLVAILDARRARGAARPAWAAAAVLAAILIAAPLAAMHPQAGSTAPTPAEMDAQIRAAIAQRDHAALERLARDLVAQSQYEEANRLAEAALELRAQQYGPQSREYAEGLEQQGQLLRREGKTGLAGEAYLKAAAIQEATGSPSAVGLEFQAMKARQDKDYARSEALYRRALTVARDPADLARVYTGLADLEAMQDRVPEAEEHFSSALAARNDDSSETAITLDLYARLLDNADRSAEAIPLRERAAGLHRAAVAAANRPLPVGQNAVKIDGGMEPPKLVYKIEPAYSEAARAAKFQGRAILLVVIGTDGTATSIDIPHPLGLGLDEEAASAVRRWRFSPAKMDGAPVPAKATVEVNFRLM